MPLYLGRRRIGYCQKSGKKVAYDDLVQDGETGSMVDRKWADPKHPQRFLPDVTQPPAPPRRNVDIEPETVLDLGPLWFD